VQENSRPGGKWVLFLNAFLSPSPGRTMDQVCTAAGKVLETQVNRAAFKLGLGPHVEWTFWQKFAATCLADTVVSAMTEDSPLAELVACHREGLNIIEQLLVEHDW
jgi:hypothetical protein